MDELSDIQSEWLETLKHHEGASSGEIAMITDNPVSRVKGFMAGFEKAGYGQYTIFDGMWYFWFSPYGNDTISRVRKSGE